jgi:hypothetical protein
MLANVAKMLNSTDTASVTTGTKSPLKKAS